jgi:glycosyltransferase involved in cell wall biosynthesis
MKRILVITHSTSNTGAPKICLSVIKFFRNKFPISSIDVISLDYGGTLEKEFIRLSSSYTSLSSLSKERNYSLTNRLSSKVFSRPILSEYEFYINYLSTLEIDLLFANTIVSLPIALTIKAERSSINLWLNLLEMNTVIDQLSPRFKESVLNVNTVILISDFHIKHIEESYGFKFKNSVAIIPPIELISERSVNKSNDDFYKIVMAGSVHWRKGDDIFIQVARKTLKIRKDVKFYWFGPIDNYHKQIIQNDIKKLGLDDYVFFLGEKEDPHSEMIDMDLFLLTSREEPFGLAPAEAGLLGLPIIYFKDVSGIGALLQEHGLDCGVNYLDIDEMTNKVVFLLDNPEVRFKISEKTKTLIERFNESYYWEKLSGQINLKWNK